METFSWCYLCDGVMYTMNTFASHTICLHSFNLSTGHMSQFPIFMSFYCMNNYAQIFGMVLFVRINKLTSQSAIRLPPSVHRRYT